MIEIKNNGNWEAYVNGVFWSCNQDLDILLLYLIESKDELINKIRNERTN